LSDDGAGGADPAGATELRAGGSVEALGGSLEVVSPVSQRRHFVASRDPAHAEGRVALGQAELRRSAAGRPFDSTGL
jgi:hypothetical protein